MSDTKTYWVRATNGFAAITYARGDEFRYESREAAERREPEPHKSTYEITVTNHGPAPEPTWWWAKWTSRNEWEAVPSLTTNRGYCGAFTRDGFTEGTARVLATSEADARAKAIDAWREAGFLPVLERAGLEVE